MLNVPLNGCIESLRTYQLNVGILPVTEHTTSKRALKGSGGVAVYVGVGVIVGVLDGVGVMVGVSVDVGVLLGVGVMVGVGVDVLVGVCVGV
jgi:hypothetical protein